MSGGDQLHVMVADVIKSFDTVDRSILGLFTWTVGATFYFSYHSQVRLMFKYFPAGLHAAEASHLALWQRLRARSRRHSAADGS